MEIFFNKLSNVLPVNDKKENVKFLLSEKIVNCSNSLSSDVFFVLKDNISNIYVDKNFITKIKNELTDVINDYIKDNLHHLDKINKANNKCGDIFLDRKNINYLTIKNLESLGAVQKFIRAMINETGSSSLKEKFFNKDKNPTINLFFDKDLFRGVKGKSVSKLIGILKNKTIELNSGCNLPFKLNDNDIIFVKLGNLKSANYNVEFNDKSCQNSKVNSYEGNNLERIKNFIMEFEIHFNFLNENIKQYHEIADNSRFFESIEEINDVFCFIDGDIIKDIKKTYYKCDDLLLFNNKLVSSFNEINNNCKALGLFYKKINCNFDDKIIINLDVDNLEQKLKEVKSNTDLLKLKLESLNYFSTCVSRCNSEFKNKLTHLEQSDKKIVYDSMTKIKGKTNECKYLLDKCIKGKETNFLSRIYGFFFPREHKNSIAVLTDCKNKIDRVLSYLNSYENKNNHFFDSNEIGLILTSMLSKINTPKNILSYLYGENKEWDNFKRSLFN